MASRVSATEGDCDGFNINCGTAGTDRLITIQCHYEGSVNLSTVTVDGKSCTKRAAITSTDNLSRTELWDITETGLGASNGTVAVAFTGAGTNPEDWGNVASLFIGIADAAPTDTGTGESGDVTTVSVINITNLDTDLLVFSCMGGYEGQTADSITSELANLTKMSVVDPYSGDAATAYGFATADNTDKTYTMTWGDTQLRNTAVMAVYAIETGVTRTLAAARVYDDSAVALAAQNVTAEEEVTTPFRTVAGVQMVGDPPAESMEWRYRVVGDPDDAIESVDT